MKNISCILCCKVKPMQKLPALIVMLFSMIASTPARADGCFLCEGGGYVKFAGDDTFAKRKEALEKFSCKVSGSTGSCTHEKGSVGTRQKKGMIAVFNDSL